MKQDIDLSKCSIMRLTYFFEKYEVSYEISQLLVAVADEFFFFLVLPSKKTCFPPAQIVSQKFLPSHFSREFGVC